MTAMMVVVELNTKNSVRNLTKSQIGSLVAKGIADLKIIEVCWKEFVQSASINIQHLCLMFQAYCLIYPVQSSALANKKSRSNPARQDDFYMIPCKLPDIISDKKVYKAIKKFATFYFDFCQYLPDEIYHRLICLASTKCEGSSSLCNCYSKRSSFFVGLEKTNWFFDMEQENQRLKIMVM